MTVARRSRVLSYLPRPDTEHGDRVLAVGGWPGLVDELVGRGYLVDRLELDLGPAAALHGEDLVPPVTAWPVPDGARDAVLLLDVLAAVVDDEAAIAEAARVLRPGGMLILRVPRAGPLAWLDAFNLYRYLHDVTGRGPLPVETRGIGWRRHYRRRDLDDLLGQRFRIRTVETSGLGIEEAVRLPLMLLLRWLLRREGTYRRANRLAQVLGRLEGAWTLGPLGYHLTVVAERLPAGGSPA